MESTILLLWLLGAIVFVLGTIVFSSEQRKIWLERLRTGRWDITASANQQRQGTGSRYVATMVGDLKSWLGFSCVSRRLWEKEVKSHNSKLHLM